MSNLINVINFFAHRPGATPHAAFSLFLSPIGN